MHEIILTQYHPHIIIPSPEVASAPHTKTAQKDVISAMAPHHSRSFSCPTTITASPERGKRGIRKYQGAGMLWKATVTSVPCSYTYISCIRTKKITIAAVTSSRNPHKLHIPPKLSYLLTTPHYYPATNQPPTKTKQQWHP